MESQCVIIGYSGLKLGINTGWAWAHTFFVFCISDLCTFCLIGKLGIDGDWVVGWGRLVGDLEALGESGGGTTTVGRRLVPSAPWQKPNLFLFWGGANSHFWDGTIQFL